MATADRSVPFTTTFSAALLSLGKVRAAGLGLAWGPYLDRLVRADLRKAGEDPPPPLPPKKNGKARASRKRTAPP